MYKLLIKVRGKNKKIREDILKEEVLKNLNLKAENYSLVLMRFENKVLELVIKDKFFLNNMIDEITKLKLENKKLSVLDLELDIQEVRLEKLKKILENKRVKIEFLTPTLFKIGSNFKSEYSNTLFFSWLLRKFNRELGIEEKIEIPKDKMERVIILNRELENINIKLNNFETGAFRGKIELDFQGIDSNLIENFEKILNYGLKHNIGYKNKNGYGKIRINN